MRRSSGGGVSRFRCGDSMKSMPRHRAGNSWDSGAAVPTPRPCVVPAATPMNSARQSHRSDSQHFASRMHFDRVPGYCAITARNQRRRHDREGRSTDEESRTYCFGSGIWNWQCGRTKQKNEKRKTNKDRYGDNERAEKLGPTRFAESRVLVIRRPARRTSTRDSRRFALRPWIHNRSGFYQSTRELSLNQLPITGARVV